MVLKSRLGHDLSPDCAHDGSTAHGMIADLVDRWHIMRWHIDVLWHNE
jgi:hypothetical protein